MKTDRESYTSKELASRINTSVKNVEKWRYTRRIPGSFRIGRAWRFDKIAIEKAINSGVFLLPDQKPLVSEQQCGTLFNGTAQDAHYERRS